MTSVYLKCCWSIGGFFKVFSNQTLRYQFKKTKNDKKINFCSFDNRDVYGL